MEKRPGELRVKGSPPMATKALFRRVAYKMQAAAELVLEWDEDSDCHSINVRVPVKISKKDISVDDIVGMIKTKVIDAMYKIQE